jgi:hypothetical protein
VAKAKKESTEDPMVAHAFDASKHELLAQMIAELPPEAAAHYVAKLEAALLKRKLQLTGYLVALVLWLVSMVFALAYFGANEGFTGWVFLVPFGVVGVTLFAFGKWAEKVGSSVGPPPELPPAAAKSASAKLIKRV